MDDTRFDVIVIGGGTAGLSGALTLARARRAVLVLDDGHPRNAPADGVHGFLTRDGIAPADLVGLGAAEAARYGATIRHGRATSARREGSGFAVGTEDGETFVARRLLVTTGLVDELPDVAGLRSRWGRDVLHCPYCHGWEVRDEPIGVLGTGPLAAHQALLFRQWSDDVTLFLHTAPDPTPDESEQLAARGVTLVEGKVAALEIADDRLTGIRLVSGDVVPVRVVTVTPRFTARSDVLTGLGLAAVEHPLGVGSHLATDATGLTAVPGVWAAGNVTDLIAQVIGAAAAGVSAAAAINADLIAEDTRLAVERHHALQQSHVAATSLRESGVAATDGGALMTDERFTGSFWDERYRSSTRLWSGEPNPQLVAEAGGITPGAALDAGCGEGADALWLARRGWHVTAVDVSTVALERAAAHADPDSSGRLTWKPVDLRTWVPEPLAYDLVNVQFMHFPRALREPVFARLAASVAPGGTLLIVGHHPSDMGTTVPRPQEPDLFFTAEELAAALDPDQWDVPVAAARPRPVRDPDGREVTIHDAVLRARRRS